MSSSRALTPGAFVSQGAAVIDEESPVACRPFRSRTRALSPAEAAVTFVMSNRVVTPHLQLPGGAMTAADAYSTEMNPFLAMTEGSVTSALVNTGGQSSDVSYLYALGTGTKHCTTAEVTVLDDIFGGDFDIYARTPPIGHFLRSADTVEIATAVLAEQHRTIPDAPTVSVR